VFATRSTEQPPAPASNSSQAYFEPSLVPEPLTLAVTTTYVALFLLRWRHVHEVAWNGTKRPPL
jgi:hypothetical protein